MMEHPKISRVAEFTIQSPSDITGAEVDESIKMALRAAAASTANDAEPFAAELASWVRDRLVTVEGVELTRDEFRRRLEALKAQFAGHAVRLRISEAAARLEMEVLNRV